MFSKLKPYSITFLILVLITVIGSTFIDTQKAKYNTKPFSILKGNRVKITLPHYERNHLSELYSKKDYKQIIFLREDADIPLKESFTTDYIVGMSYYHTRQYKKAAYHLAPLLAKDSPIKERLYYYLGASYHYTGGHKKSSIYLKALRTNYPKSPFLYKTIEMECKLLLALKKPLTLIKTFSPYLKTDNKKIKGRLYYFIGSAYQSLNNKSKALKQLTNVIGLTGSAYTRRALKKLKSLNPKYEKSLAPNKLIQIAHYYYRKRGRKNQKKRDYKKVLALLKVLPEQIKSQTRFQRLSLAAKVYRKLYQNKKAQKTYQKILSSFRPSSKYYKKGEYLYAQFLERKNRKKAYSYYKKVVMTPNHPYVREACDKIPDFIQYQDKKMTKLLIEKSLSLKKYRVIDKILFDWINKKRYRDVLTYFSVALKSNMDRRFRVKLLYWLGKSALQLGDKKKAIHYFKEASLSYKRDYYTYKSMKEIELTLLRNKKFSSSFYKEDQKHYHRFLHSPTLRSRASQIKYSFNFARVKDPLFKKAFFLIALGEIDNGYRVFLRFLKTLGKSRLNYAIVIAKMFYDMKLYQFSIRYSDFMVKHLNGKNGRNDILPELKASSYPLFFKKAIFKAAKKYKVDPYLIFAIIREESRFFPNAISRSGAMGLMQLMPGTGRYLLRAKKGDSINFFDKWLNVLLGTKYINQLLQKDSVAIALAGYNGGPGRIRRLYKKFDKKVDLLDDEHFVELIGINETRNYVKKVLTSYYNYKEIYQ